MDPATLATLGSLGISAFGGKQLGPAAPAYTPGFNPGIQTPQMPEQSGFQLLQDQGALGGLLGNFGGGKTAESVAPSIESPESVGYGPSGQDPFNLPGKDEGGFMNTAKGIFGGIDKGLQSPSQIIGLGLLSQLSGGHPAAGIAGLLGMGLLNRNK